MMRVSWPARCRSPESCDTPRLSPVKSLISATRAICDLRRSRPARPGHATQTRTDPGWYRAPPRGSTNETVRRIVFRRPFLYGRAPHGTCGAGRTWRPGSAGVARAARLGAASARRGGVHLLPGHAQLLRQRRLPPPADLRQRRAAAFPRDAVRRPRAGGPQPRLCALRPRVRDGSDGVLLDRTGDARRERGPSLPPLGPLRRVAAGGVPRRAHLGRGSAPRRRARVVLGVRRGALRDARAPDAA